MISIALAEDPMKLVKTKDSNHASEARFCCLRLKPSVLDTERGSETHQAQRQPHYMRSGIRTAPQENWWLWLKNMRQKRKSPTKWMTFCFDVFIMNLLGAHAFRLLLWRVRVRKSSRRDLTPTRFHNNVREGDLRQDVPRVSRAHVTCKPAYEETMPWK